MLDVLDPMDLHRQLDLLPIWQPEVQGHLQQEATAAVSHNCTWPVWKPVHACD